jgi:hypothetical protein
LEIQNCKDLYLQRCMAQGDIMKGRQKGRPTKWVQASVQESLMIGKPGIQFEVWEKWKRKKRKLGTLIVSVGGLRWKPNKGRIPTPKGWRALAEWFAGTDV